MNIVHYVLGALVAGVLSQAQDIQRTVVFIYAPTAPGQNVFLRGGIDSSVRPNCVGTAASDPCAISISHRIVPQDETSSYSRWSTGDVHLDWYGEEQGQGVYLITPAEGTPLMWTTSTEAGVTDPTVEVDGYGYTSLNRFGDHYWMLDVDMDCSQTESGWFEFKAYVTPTVGWESDIAQYDLCAGLPTILRPYTTSNHFARCGHMTVFYYSSDDCNVYEIPVIVEPVTPDVCGQRNMFPDASSWYYDVTSRRDDVIDGRIVNGNAASLGRWPWQGVLEYNDVAGGCACVLIDTQWAVTAAHCVTGTDPRILRVRFGEQNLLADQGNEQAIQVFAIYIHEKYGEPASPGVPEVDNDIALLLLLVPVDFSSYVVNLACLPRGYGIDDFVADECWATGFGDTKGTADQYRLNEIQVPVYTHDDCIAAWGEDEISVRQVCMGTTTESACGGDSGGPLVCWRDGHWVLVGTTSWGSSICQGEPSVYTRMTEFIEWMDSIMLLEMHRHTDHRNEYN